MPESPATSTAAREAASSALRAAAAESRRASRRPWGAVENPADAAERRAAAALMAVGNHAAFMAAARRRPRPTLAAILDAGADAALEALAAAPGRNPAAALRGAPVEPDVRAALAGAVGARSTVGAPLDGLTYDGPDLALVASAGRALDRDTAAGALAFEADDDAAPLDNLRAAGSAERDERERRYGLDLADAAAAPLDADTLAAVEGAFPGGANVTVRTALVAALAGANATDLAPWLDKPTAAVRQSIRRGAERLRSRLAADDAAAVNGWHAVAAAAPRASLDDAALAALILDDTEPSNDEASASASRAPRYRAPSPHQPPPVDHGTSGGRALPQPGGVEPPRAWRIDTPAALAVRVEAHQGAGARGRHGAAADVLAHIDRTLEAQGRRVRPYGIGIRARRDERAALAAALAD